MWEGKGGGEEAAVIEIRYVSLCYQIKGRELDAILHNIYITYVGYI